MPDTFRFKKEPQWLYDRALVVLCVEDFECLLRLAERWLNSDGQVPTQHFDSHTRPATVEKYEPNMREADGGGMLEEAQPNNDRLLTLQKFGPKVEESDDESVLSQVCSSSKILNSAEGQKLGKSPLDFLSKELSKFTSAKAIFSTQHLFPNTAIASEFHKACDNVPNVLVIIKSGQYIAGGYTEVPFESRARNSYDSRHFKPNPKLTTFLFSVNKKKLFPLKDKSKALNCRYDRGPSFGSNGLSIADDYIEFNRCQDNIHKIGSSFYSPTNTKGELFGVCQFTIDEYEVYKLE